MSQTFIHSHDKNELLVSFSKCFRIIVAKPDFNDLHVKSYSKQHFLREYVCYALTQHVWVLFGVLSTGGLVSLMSYTCFKPYSSYHIQPNGLQNALRTMFRDVPELTYEAENSRLKKIRHKHTIQKPNIAERFEWAHCHVFRWDADIWTVLLADLLLMDSECI